MIYRRLVVFFSLGLAGVVLVISLYRESVGGVWQYAGNRLVTADASPAVRLGLEESVLVPGSPVYMARAALDRVFLWTALTDTRRFQLRLEYSAGRMSTAVLMADNDRSAEALMTALKAYYYLIEAVEMVENGKIEREEGVRRLGIEMGIQMEKLSLMTDRYEGEMRDRFVRLQIDYERLGERVGLPPSVVNQVESIRETDGYL